MHADVRLSTRFLTARNAHQVGLLTTITADLPVRRAPINLALVLDRSGSMAGPKLAAARQAAAGFASYLGADDRLSIVVFDDTVTTIFGPAPADPEAARGAIDRVLEGGTTNLSGGWLEGRRHVAERPMAEGVNRVVLFTDGEANVGIVDHGQLVGLARGAATDRVSTTCVGFGDGFNEDLLRDMSAASDGNFWYVEDVDQMASIFSGEIEGLVTLAAQNVEVEVVLADARVAGVSFLQDLPVTRTEAGTWRVRIGDIYGSAPRSVGVLFHVEGVADIGDAVLGEVRLTADAILNAGVEHRRIVMPIRADLDGRDHPEPVVERTFLRFEAARARAEAVRRADIGDLEGAGDVLRECAAALNRRRHEDASLAEEADDLAAAAARLRRRQYDRADRKYHSKRAQATDKQEQAYLAMISRVRRRPGEPKGP